MPRTIRLLTLCVATLVLSPLRAQSPPTQNPAPDPSSVPVIDGGAGPCSADFTVIDSNQAAVYNAKISVHIAYGFGGFRKLDLQVGTNSNGKARFTGLPSRTKDGLFFQAVKGDAQGSAFVDPAKNCNATMTIELEKKAP